MGSPDETRFSFKDLFLLGVLQNGLFIILFKILDLSIVLIHKNKSEIILTALEYGDSFLASWFGS